MIICKKCNHQTLSGEPTAKIFEYRDKPYPNTEKIGREIAKEEKVCYNCFVKENKK